MALNSKEKQVVKIVILVLIVLVAWQLFTWTLGSLFGGMGSIIALLVFLGLAYYFLVKERWLDKL